MSITWGDIGAMFAVLELWLDMDGERVTWLLAEVRETVKSTKREEK